MHISQQLCGINAVFYYSTMFFEGTISNPLLGTTIVALVNVLATWLAQILMDRCFRKTLLLWSSGGMLVSILFLTLALMGVVPKLGKGFSHCVKALRVVLGGAVAGCVLVSLDKQPAFVRLSRTPFVTL